MYKDYGGGSVTIKKIKIILIIILVLLCVNLLIRDYLPVFQKAEGKTLIVIDAGHGGSDPGKVGINKALEKDINLSIALMLKEYLEKKDITVIMTRDSDNGLYAKSASNKKRSDLKARVNIANESKPELVISIHQNSYQTKDCKGAQVFYYKDSLQGEKLAGYIQQSLILNVDQDNKRNIKENSNYFLLKEITVPTVIVECGFLSNPEEAELLITNEYQEKIAYGIFAGIIEFLENNEDNLKN